MTGVMVIGERKLNNGRIRKASRRVYPGASVGIIRRTKRRDKPGGSLSLQTAGLAKTSNITHR
jgi:hypothetical protein